MPNRLKIPDQKMVLDEIMHDYELRYHIMSESVTMGMFRLTPGPESRVLSANHFMARMLGYDSPDALAEKPLSELVIVPDNYEDLTTTKGRAGTFTSREILMKCKDGSEIWVSVQAWKLENANSSVAMIEGFAQDITEHKVFEQEVQYHESELNRFTLELSQANKKLNILSTITRHDILNRLTGMQGYLDLMKVEYSDPRIQEYLAIQETIIETINRQIRFTRDYQNVGIESPCWVNVKETIEKAAASVALPAVTQTVEIDNLWVYADPMFEKVFYNLFENSLRHAGKLTRIRCFAQTGGDTAQIIYEDDGVGVPEHYKEAIFVRKYFKNTGFGLYLSREILDITGLTIRETGKPGSGARFEITIPQKNFRIMDTTDA
jgi:PAS domain S-box-containing protein